MLRGVAHLTADDPPGPRQALCELLPALQGTVLAQAQANLAAWRGLDTAAACNDAPTLEELDKSSRTHSRRGSRTWSRIDPNSSSQGPSPVLLGPRSRSDSWKACRLACCEGGRRGGRRQEG